MADDDQGNQDEYQFADLDVLGAEQDTAASPEDDLAEGLGDEGVASPPGRGRFDHLDPKVIKIIQKGAIAVVALVFVLFVYKIGSSFFTSKKSTPKTASIISANTNQSTKTPAKTQPLIQTQTALPMHSSGAASDETLSALRREQTQIENELSGIRNQISTIVQNINEMSSKFDDVKQTMLVLNERLEQQSQQMGRLKVMSRSSRVASSKPAPRPRSAAPKPIYSVQAIIPGRAWLMSSQGETLTVNRGSTVPGYGSVRLINAKLGRVFTSSGRVIQFSQADS